MTPERLRRIANVLEAVRGLEKEERREYLEVLTAGDQELGRQVEAYLEPLESTEPASGPARSESDPRDRIGPYEVIESLGVGGMGSVYLAQKRERSFERRVAIKVVRPGFDVKEVHRRFVSERQILATFDHPHIARLFDGGTTRDGRPYLVMEYIDGRPIDRYCDDERLGIRDRLRLLVDVCDAVRYAHSRLVVHRDLKPSNIMVTRGGTVKLLDFGIAKLLDPGEFPLTVHLTETGRSPMTPHYASPEQVRGEPITTATDVYSLGVLSYQLLSGRLPYRFSGRKREVLINQLERAEPMKPSLALLEVEDSGGPSLAERLGVDARDLQRQVSGDLDNIVLMALRGDPSRRYATVEQLSDDLGRHLEGRPVQARQDSFAYRARKFVGRHRLPVTLVFFLLVALVGFAVSSARQASAVARERNVALAAQQRAEAALAEAELAGAAEKEVVNFMVEIFRGADLDLRSVDALEPRDLLESGARRVELELAARPRVQLRLRLVLARAYYSLGEFAASRELCEKALAMFDERGENFAPVQRVEALLSLGRLAMEENALEEAERFFAEALARAKALRLEEFQIQTLTEKGHLELARGEPQSAIGLLRGALEQFSGTAEPDGNIVEAYTTLCQAVREQGDVAEALRVCKEAVTRMRRQEGLETALASALESYGGVLAEAGRYQEARPVYEEMLEIRRRLLGEDHAKTAQSYSNLGVVFFELGDYKRAVSLFSRAMEGTRRALGPYHPNYGALVLNTAYAELFRGRVDTSRRFLREARRAITAGVGEKHFYFGLVLSLDARLAAVEGDLKRALERAGRGRSLLAGTLGEGHYLTRINSGFMARIAADTEDWPAVERYAAEALQEGRRDLAVPAAAEGRYLAAWSLGRKASTAGDSESAKREYRRAVAIVEQDLHADHPYLAGPLLDLARLARQAGNLEEARRLALRARTVLLDSVEPEHAFLQQIEHFLDFSAGAVLKSSR